jgi:predicted enzyme related to lactoylglutathione lyase
MNGICHIEIPSKDFDKARRFYGDLFNWKFQDMEGMDYLLFNPPDGVGGGFSKNAEFASEPGISLYVEVEDIEAIIKKAGGLGGQCPRGKTPISPEHGFFAELIDLEGNKIGIWGKK